MITLDDKFDIVVTTLAGLEEVLADELKALACEDVEILKRAVSFKGDRKMLYKANYWLRTAIRVLVPIEKFPVKDENELYKEITKLPWWKLVSVDGTIAVDGVVHESNITHSKYIALKTKDAIVDQFRRKFDKRPSVDTDNPDLRINIHITNNNCTVSLDSSGKPLNQRGYRKTTHQAPINEALAAGLILLSGWKRDCNFIDPMCGSGTLPIEAAMIAYNIPAGMFRKTYGFLKWMDFDRRLWKSIVEESYSEGFDFEHEIIGSDISKLNIEMAMENIKEAKLHKDIELFVRPIEEILPPEGSGLMICNPPYGERLQEDDIIELYKKIGDALKQKFAGYNAWIVSSDLNAMKYIGLRPSRKIKVFNGPLECRFMKFEVYEGSKKAKKNLEE